MTERGVIEYKCDLCGVVVVTEVKPLPEGWLHINNPVPDYMDSKRDCYRHVCDKCKDKLINAMAARATKNDAVNSIGSVKSG